MAKEKQTNKQIAKQPNKQELINILIETYGYKEEDISTLTNAGLKSLIKKEEDEAEDFEASLTVEKVKQVFKDDDLVHVMSGFGGSLRYKSIRNDRVWMFSNFGQVDKLPYAELLNIKNNSPKVFSDGWIIILNKQIQEDFGLVETYKHIITPENIDSIFSKNATEVEDFLNNLPKGMKAVFFSKARELYNKNILDSRSLIELIEEHFDVSLKDNAPITEVI